MRRAGGCGKPNPPPRGGTEKQEAYKGEDGESARTTTGIEQAERMAGKKAGKGERWGSGTGGPGDPPPGGQRLGNPLSRRFLSRAVAGIDRVIPRLFPWICGQVESAASPTSSRKHGDQVGRVSHLRPKSRGETAVTIAFPFHLGTEGLSRLAGWSRSWTGGRPPRSHHPN